MDLVIKPLDTIPEDKKVRVPEDIEHFWPVEKPTNQIKRVHSENNADINFNRAPLRAKSLLNLGHSSLPQFTNKYQIWKRKLTHRGENCKS